MADHPPEKGISIILPMRDERLLARQKIEEVILEIKDSNHEEIIVIDSGSVDGTGEIARNTLQESSLPKNRWEVISSDFPGKTRAINLGVSIANFEIIVMMDADAICTPGWLSVCYEIFTNSEIGLACGIENFEDQNYLKSSEKMYKSISNRRRLRQSNKSSIVIAEGSLCCFRRSCLANNPLDDRYNADDTQITLICSRNNLRSIMSPSLEFRDNPDNSRGDNFWRRVRRGRGITNALLRNLDLALPRNNQINPKEFRNTASLYLIAPWIPVVFLSLCLSIYSEIYNADFLPKNEILAIIIFLFLLICFSSNFIRSYLLGCLIMVLAQISSLTNSGKDAWNTDRSENYVR